MPSVLIEYEFYSNKDGVNLLKNRRDLLCESTVKAVCAHFGVNYKSGSVKMPKQVEASPVNNKINGQYPNGTYNKNGRVNVNSLNVRKGRPGTAGYNTILGQVRKDDIIKVGYCLNNWFGIVFNGKQGFVCGDYVDVDQ